MKPYVEKKKKRSGEEKDEGEEEEESLCSEVKPDHNCFLRNSELNDIIHPWWEYLYICNRDGGGHKSSFFPPREPGSVDQHLSVPSSLSVMGTTDHQLGRI